MSAGLWAPEMGLRRGVPATARITPDGRSGRYSFDGGGGRSHDAPQSHACGGHATCQWELPRLYRSATLGDNSAPSLFLARAPGRSIIAGAIGSDSVGHGWSRIERTVELSTVADSVHGGSRGRLLHLPMRGVAILDSGACSRVPLPARACEPVARELECCGRAPPRSQRPGSKRQWRCRLGPARLADRDDRAREPRERGRSVLPPGGGW